MEENYMCHSTAMGYKKGFYKKLVNPKDHEIKNLDHDNRNLRLLNEADKRCEHLICFPLNNILMMISNLPIFGELILQGESPTKMPKQAAPKSQFHNKIAIAVESLMKDITEESFGMKTEILSKMDVIQIKSDNKNLSETDTTTQMLKTKTMTWPTPLSKSPSYSQYHVDWDKGEEYRAKATLVKTTSLKDLSKEEESKEHMVHPQIVPTRHNKPKWPETEVTTPVSTDSRTPILEIKHNRLWDEQSTNR
uniref:Uncharacterized protein n=1 Tax=Romanomermis culicivorax TaxID=13658 RepID=A0A915HR28_ROMCU